MDISSVLTSGPAFALFGVLATMLANYLIQLKKGGTDIQLNERKTLSEDQENFKKSILEELKSCREAVDKLTEDSQSWQQKAISVQEQKLALTEQIIHFNQKTMEMEKKILHLEAVIEAMRIEASKHKEK